MFQQDMQQPPPPMPPPGAVTAQPGMAPDAPPPSAGQHLAAMAGQLDQKIQDITQALSMVTQILQEVLGQGAVTADQPGGPMPTGGAPEDMAEGGPDAMGMETDPNGPGEDPGMMGVRIDPMQLAQMQQKRTG